VLLVEFYFPLFVGYLPQTGNNLAPILQLNMNKFLFKPNKLILSGVVMMMGRADRVFASSCEGTKAKGPGRAVFLTIELMNRCTFTAVGGMIFIKCSRWRA
jgi:hypothetical protein